MIYTVICDADLHNEGLVAPAGGGPHEGHVGGLIDKVLKTVEDTTTGGRGAAVDATLVDGLASHTSVGVDVVVT